MSGIYIRAAALAFVVATVLCASSVEGKAKHYAVKVQDPADLQKVADILTQQGLIVKRINKRFNFISVRTSDDTPVSASSTDLTSGPRAAPCSDPLGCTTGDEPSFFGPPASDSADDTTATTAASDPTIAAAFAALPAGVEIEADAQVYMMGRRLESRSTRSLLQDLAAEASAAAGACGALPDSGMVGRTQEAAPYGIKMVQGDDNTMIQLSKDFRKNVMFCIIDTGVDRTHWEFSKDDTTGCVPGRKRANSTANCKYDWGVDHFQHGTHTAGTIGALRNGKGVVGVTASGAQIYEYNAFGPDETFSMTLVVDAWEDCIAELDDRKAKLGQKNLKMIVSMSIGSDGDVKVVKDAVKQLAAERAQDVLFVAAAGNGAQQGAVYSYPASYPEVVSIAAVDWTKTRAVFSQVNNDVEWAAPGVQTLSTIPMADAAVSSYNQQPSLTVSGAQSTQNDVFSKPGPSALSGCKADVVTGGVVDCGTGDKTCAGATGKICLVQRGGNMFCEKVYNCVQGGGVGTIIYGKADEPACETFEGVLDYTGCPNPSSGWPVAMTVTRGQGEALLALVKANAGVQITLDARQAANPLPLDFMSGTSMATPTASGVAGLVWSAHTDCSASEIRAAVSWTAMDVGKKGYDREYGYGIVQAAAAHQYLLAHPCNGGTATQPPRTSKATSLRTLTIMSSVPRDASPAAVGSTVQFTITVAKSADGQNIANVPVRIESNEHLSCDSTRVNTNAKGIAVASCAVKSPGTATLTATIGTGERAVTATSRIRVVARRNGL